jgi:8-oxo-dGTP diphosphatase
VKKEEKIKVTAQTSKNLLCFLSLEESGIKYKLKLIFCCYTIRMKKNRATAIIIQNRKLLLIHRQKPGRDFYVLPGGGVEFEESFEEACIREVKEETGLDVLALQLVSRYISLEKEENYYFTEVTPAEPVLGGAEATRQSPADSYTL